MTKLFSDPEKEYVYSLFVSYFDNIALEKVRDEDLFSIYMARFPCLLLNEQRYIVLMTPKDNFPPSYVQSLDQLRWVSLQTRTLQNEYPDLIQQSFQQKQQASYKKKLSIVSRSNNISVYDVQDLPLRVSLLHTKGNEYEYPNQGNLISALETYRTIIYFHQKPSEF